jgi:2-oxoglutarate ferredoxin oxidoreductase subunit gamma
MREEIQVCGSGGQGVIMLAVLLADMYGMEMGLQVVQTQAYGPAARGGTSQAEVVVSDEKIYYVKAEKVSVFTAFNQESFDKYSGKVDPNAKVFVDSTLVNMDSTKRFKSVYAIPATKIAENDFKPVVVNIIMLGFMAAKLGLKYEDAEKAIVANLPSKVIEMNKKALTAGYERGK